MAAVLVTSLLVSACSTLTDPFDGIVTLEGPGIELQPQPEAAPSVIVASDGTVLATLRREYREHVDLETLPPMLIEAVLAAEDQRFWEHGGLDARALARAAGRNLAAGEVVEGGSTITQQLVELRFQPPLDDTLGTKAAEAALALQLEEDFPKDWILEEYLDTVYLGGGAHGVGAAAWSYFRAEPSELTVAQSALLAGLIRTPGAADPRVAPEAARQRRDTVLSLMVETGALTTAEAGAAMSEPIVVREPPPAPAWREPHWVDHVLRRLLEDRSLGADEGARWRALTGAGLTIHTSLDLDAQDAARRALDEALTGTDAPDGAIVTLDPTSGAIVAAVSSVPYDDLQFDLATQAVRQPGSVFKGITLTAALADGYSATQMIDARGGRVATESSGTWQLNATGRSTATLQSAVWRSDNAAFARLGLDLGVPRVIATARSLGVTSPMGDHAATLLGGTDTCCTPLELAAAYGTLAAFGTHVPPHPVSRITDPDGEVLWTRPAGELVLDEVVAFDAIDILRGVVRRGTGQAAAVPGHDVMGKTGTSSDNADGWFVGATPDATTAVWIGHHDGRRTARVDGRRVTGGGTPARIFASYMATLLGPGPGDPFTVPASRLVAVEVDVKTGLLPAPWCPDTEVRMLPDSRIPTATCPDPRPTATPSPTPTATPSPTASPGPGGEATEPTGPPRPTPSASPSPDATAPAAPAPSETPAAGQPTPTPAPAPSSTPDPPPDPSSSPTAPA